MTETINLQFTEIETGQSGKENTFNANLERFDVFGAGAEEVANSPSVSTNGTVYMVGDSPTGDFASNPNEIAYYSQIEGDWIFLNVDQGFVIHNKTEDVLYVLGASGWEPAATEFTQSYDIPFAFVTEPDAGAIFGTFAVPRTIVFPADFSGSLTFIGTNPLTNYSIDIQDDSSSIGTLDIESGGSYAFATTSGTAKTVVAGSRLDVIAPGATDGTIEEVSFTLKGTVL